MAFPVFWFHPIDNGCFDAELYERKIELQFMVQLEKHVYLVIDGCDASYVLRKKHRGSREEPELIEMMIPVCATTVDEIKMIHDILRFLRDSKKKPNARSVMQAHIQSLLDHTEKRFLQHVKDYVYHGKTAAFPTSPSVFGVRMVEAHCVAPGASVTNCTFDNTSVIGIQQ